MKFSVLLPTRNRLDLLAFAIETVRRQDHADWEIVVSDNCSEEDVGGYVASLRDPRIRYHRTERFVPVTDNWNRALERSTGDYVVMLGDDDGLMRGYFSSMERILRQAESPDVVYTNAFLYAYPGVMPSNPAGFLRTYTNRPIFAGAREPFWLGADRARAFARDSLRFRATFDYNMQFSLVSRRQIEASKVHGSFFQSPYPDYYATNALMLEASRILVDPAPRIAIGISPRSFGFFYFNGAEADGNQFLNNLPDPRMLERLVDVILPGPVMNTSWLVAMETLATNLGPALPAPVDHDRYRRIQILAVYAAVLAGKRPESDLRLLRDRLRPGERLRLGAFLSALVRLAPRRYRPTLARRVEEASGSHPRIHMPDVAGTYSTMLDVFERVDPTSHRLMS